MPSRHDYPNPRNRPLIVTFTLCFFIALGFAISKGCL